MRSLDSYQHGEKENWWRISTLISIMQRQSRTLSFKAADCLLKQVNPLKNKSFSNGWTLADPIASVLVAIMITISA